MGGIKKVFRKIIGKRKQAAGGEIAKGSKAVTGIDPGDAGSNVAGRTTRPRPGRRNADTPLGARYQRL